MKRSHLLHPGTILGTLVLVAAVSGSVYGATTTGSATIGSLQIKNGSIKLLDISPKAREALRGARGLPGVATAGVAGPAGPAGPAGAPGTARAFGFVSSAGVVNAAQSKNIAATRISAGVYCVTPVAASGINPATTPISITPDFQDGVGSVHVAMLDSDGTNGCARTVGWTVRTLDFTSPNFAASDLAFTVVVP